MSLPLRWLLAAAALLLCVTTRPAGAEEKDEMVANPYYTFWSGFKKGCTAVHLETSKIAGPNGRLVPDGTDEKRIAYKLVEVGGDRVVVEMVVTERDFLGFVESAPTRYIYPAKVKKSHLERVLAEAGAKKGEETITFMGKELKCRTIAGVVKGPDGEESEYKLWLNDTIPGQVVKKTRTSRQKGEVVAETTVVVQSCEKGE
jgi:hypothetical protein